MQNATALVDSRASRPASDLDRLAEIAAALCGVPIAYVAAFDEKTQWFQARVGMDIESTSREHAVCGTVFTAGRDVTINDLYSDPRTARNPVVNQMELRFYSGHPVRNAEGNIVGTVCVMDHEPRPNGLNASQSMGLAALAEQAAVIFGLRQTALQQVAVLENHELREKHDRRRITRLSALVNLGDRLRDVTTPGEAFEVAAEILGVTLDALQAGCAQIDLETRTATVEHDWSREGVPSSNGVHRFEDHPDIFGEMIAGRPMRAIDVMVNDATQRSHLRTPVMSHGRLVGMVYVIDHAIREWVAGDIEFTRGVADRVHETIDRLLAQEAREIMVGEIGHRMKNMMAVTRAISMQTLSGRASPDVVRDLDERLAAYSGAHDLLIAGGGDEAELRETAIGALSRLSVAGRVDMEGEDVSLDERATLTLSLLVNELATNAIKHGALSRPRGRVSLRWSIEGPTLCMEWRERGGPRVTEPTRRGFGRRILDIGLRRAGGTTLDYAPEGLTARFCVPAHEVLAKA